MNDQITIALTKGRPLAQELDLLARMDIIPVEDPFTSRKLIFKTSADNVSLIVLRNVDVATFVEHGIADVGMAGRDVLLEHGEEGYYQPLDLKIGKCQLIVAGLEGDAIPLSKLKVATKFVKTAKRFYAEKGIQVDIIELHGAMELAPVTGLSHQIVDIFETGNTLKANGLVVIEHIAEISTRLIVNKTSMKMKHEQMQTFVDRIAKIVKAND